MHCRTLLELEEEAERRRCNMEKDQMRMEEEIKESERMLKEQGVINGHRYDLYTIEDIQKISNYEFLSDILANIFPAGQPSTEEECQELGERFSAESKRDEVLFNDMEWDDAYK